MGIRERVAEVRDAVGSNAELARVAEVSRASVTKWLAGDVNALKALNALNIEERTGYAARWLVLGKGPKRLTATGTSEPSITPYKGSDNQVKAPAVGANSPVEARSDAEKLLFIVRAFLDSDPLGKDAIWSGARVAASKRGVRSRRLGSASSDSR